MSDRSSSSIGMSGVKQTLAALHAFAPEIEDKLNNTIRDALEETRTSAKARYPGGSWVIGQNKKKILGYIAARGGGRRAGRWGDSSGGVRAAIFEFAGSTQPGRTPQAQGLIKHLEEKYGTPGRFLWSAWDATGKSVLARIGDAMRQAERDLQTALDNAGEGF